MEMDSSVLVPDVPSKKTFGYYSQPINMKVAPLRSSIMNDIQIAIKQNNFDRDTIPMFKSQLEKTGVIASKQNIQKKIEANTSKNKLIPGTLMHNEEFAHVFEAMKQSTKELQNSIVDDYPVFFDTIPVMFDPIDPDENLNGWNVLKEKIYERKGGIRNLDLATTRMQENFSYMN
jgi:hypothetical protein